MTRLVLLVLTSCTMLPGTESPSTDHSPVSASRPPVPVAELPSVGPMLDAADALAASDPERAAERYREARVELMRRWGELHGGDLPNNRIMRSFGHIDSEREGEEAKALLWRSFLGRSAVLTALGREQEVIGELPGYSMWKRDCPAEHHDACVAHLARIAERFPHAATKSMSDGKLYTQITWRVDREPNDLDTQKGLFELPTLAPQLAEKGWVLIEMTAHEVSRDKAGRVVLRLRGIGIGISTGSDCRKVLRHDSDGAQLVDKCKNVSHEKIRPPQLEVIARPAPDLPDPKWGDAYLIVADGRKLERRGSRFVWRDAAILRVSGKRGIRYWFGANLDWSFTEPT